ncbi:MAG TPA: phospholipase D-like domain-containing protein [Candidatus Absconditabacterales bacterium]|nr:phospholipase D-like domain-containing protein [Candidatus Absconditabacterales bacterium]
MAIQIFSNLNYPIGNIINQEMHEAKNVQIAVAFLKYTGVKVIEKSMRQCLDNGGSFEIIAGLDFKTTDSQALQYFLNLKKEYSKVNFYCFGDRKENKTDIVFHPKIYLFEKERETTGIVGSANMTKGGLMTNFEVNTVFKETKPLYFSQLQAIYNSVKFTDSIFVPDEEYLSGYTDVFKAFSQNEEKAKKDLGLQKVIKEIQRKEEVLPGTVPSLKLMIINIIRENKKKGIEFTPLQEIYEKMEKIVEEEKLTERYKMDTFRNTIRGELNTHEDNSNHPSNLNLFIRSADKKGFYSLTQKGENYEGR